MIKDILIEFYKVLKFVAFVLVEAAILYGLWKLGELIFFG